MEDQYHTVSAPGESLYKVKGSKHFGYVWNVRSEKDIKERLEEIKKVHHSARHHCYAWKLGLGEDRYRANDDGEPSNSAGKPIYGAILSAGITNVLIVVVRYFGGTKLGVGGLIDAYRTAAKMAIEDTNIEQRYVKDRLKITFPYAQMGAIMSLLKEMNLPVEAPNFEITCTLETEIRASELNGFMDQLNDLVGVETEIVE